MTELLSDENEIQEFCFQIKKYIKNYKKKKLDLCPKIVKSYLLPECLDLVKKRRKILETVSNPRKIIKVIQIIH